MKRLVLIAIIFTIIVSLTACSSSEKYIQTGDHKVSTNEYEANNKNKNDEKKTSSEIQKNEEKEPSTFLKILDEENGNMLLSVRQTDDGGYIAGGFIKENKESRARFMKFDEKGNKEWSTIYDGSAISNVLNASDGGYIFELFIDQLSLLTKIDENGELQWSKGYDDNYIIWSIKQTIDGGYILLGDKYNDGWLVKVDEKGNEEWSNIYNKVNVVHSRNNTFLQQTEDGGYLFVNDKGLFKLDEKGTEQWSYSDLSGYVAVQTEDGGYILAPGLRSQEPKIIKIDDQGKEQWSKTLGAYYGTIQILQTKDEGYMLIRTNSLLKLDQEGNIQWVWGHEAEEKLMKQYGLDSRPEISVRQAQQTKDGGYILTGYINMDNNMKGLLVKLDSNGKLIE